MLRWVWAAWLCSLAAALLVACEQSSIVLRGPAPKRRVSRSELKAWIDAHAQYVANKYPQGIARRSAVPASLANFRHDGMWTVHLSVGTPGNTHTVIVDTGSADLWLSSKSYNTHNSKTFQRDQEQFSLSYTTGSVKGYAGSDHVSIGHAVAQSQRLGVVTNAANLSLPKNITGILGLAFQSLSVINAKPFWQNANLDAPVFSLYLQRDNTLGTAEYGDAGGLLSLGAPNASLYDGDINYINVEDAKHWLIPMDGLAVGGKSIHLRGHTTASFDSGTAMIGGPSDTVRAVYAHIHGAVPMATNPGHYSYPCSLRPNISFSFGSRQYYVNHADFEVLVIGPSSTNSSEMRCLGALFELSGDPSLARWLIGAAFMKNVYTIFDGGKTKRLGLASLRDEHNNGTESSPAVLTSGVAAHARPPLALLVALLLLMVYH
ncbi:cathepsin D [Malassezia japonica]|uniref:Cathepsin D n=1 Tax=Malassezia japonica TaxID=223818 RepID=A0AAF0F6P9_9BASI|nr:cathepsin D [Malassezia japonica]WFD39428.1 cathepsin D [Malassezia japonica]